MTEIEKRVQENIEFENQEESSNYIICPYCGFQKLVEYEMYFGGKKIDVFEEGEQDIKCPRCGHTFRLSKEFTWRYFTEILND